LVSINRLQLEKHEEKKEQDQRQGKSMMFSRHIQ